MKKGFTLIELIVVLALIGILTTVSTLALRSARQRTRDAERISNAQQIRSGLELGFAELASYPAQSEGDLVLGGREARTLCEVSGLPRLTDDAGQCTGTVFLSVVPSAPTPKDGKCAPVQNAYRYRSGSGNTEFRVEFCLGQAPRNSGLAHGLNCISPRGIEPGACK